MELVFCEVVKLSYIGSIIIGIVLLLRFLMRGLPKKYSYLLWFIPALRLLCPVSFRGIWGLLEQIEKSTNVPGSSMTLAEGFIDRMNEVQYTWGTQNITIYNDFLSDPAYHTKVILWILGSYIWLIGIAVLLIRNIVAYVKLRRRVRVSVRQEKHIFLVDGIASPFVMGIFPAKIYLSSSIQWEKYAEILAHEEIHRRRYDHLWKLFAYLIVILHWFNPVVWLGFFYFVRDMEMSCDEAVLRSASVEEKQKYAHTLLEFATGGSYERFPVAFSEKNTKGRIKNLLKEKKQTKAFRGLAVTTLLLAGVLMIPNFESEEFAEALSDREAVKPLAEGTFIPGIAGIIDGGEVTGGKVAYIVNEDEEDSSNLGVQKGYPVVVYDYKAEDNMEELKLAVEAVLEAFHEEYPDMNPDARGSEDSALWCYTIKQIVYDEEESARLLKKYNKKEGMMIQLDVNLPEMFPADSSRKFKEFGSGEVRDWSWHVQKKADGSYEVTNCRDGSGMRALK